MFNNVGGFIAEKGRASNMIAGGLVQDLKSGDVKGALAGVGTEARLSQLEG